MRLTRAATLFALLPVVCLAETIPEPTEYRMDTYRAPVPASIAGGTVVGPKAAYALWQDGGAAFIDVMPQAPKPQNLPEGTIWREKPRESIPGAIWLANVGYGAIANVTQTYFRKGLQNATNGDRNYPVVMFCLADCWMSWNAAKRAIEWGYSEVYWMPEGTDGWAALSYPLESVLPAKPQDD